jgi:plastocyanin
MVSWRRSSISLAVAALIALPVAGCSGESEEADLANGKRLYTGALAEGQKKPDGYQPCSACHALARANATSTVGPNLDEAFATAKKDGMTDRTVQGVVYDQILHPLRSSVMPAGIVKGDDARDVAAYVAAVAGEGGKDTGQLATIGAAQNTKPIAAENGVLTLEADPTGQLAFASTRATAPAGPLTLTMPNPSPIQHNIAQEDGPTGPVVGTGGTSEIKVNLQPGEYVYLCTVPGHAEGGMKGTLTVE